MIEEIAVAIVVVRDFIVIFVQIDLKTWQQRQFNFDNLITNIVKWQP
jgi:hypothetical protein